MVKPREGTVGSLIERMLFRCRNGRASFLKCAGTLRGEWVRTQRRHFSHKKFSSIDLEEEVEKESKERWDNFTWE